jgi:hypothetical protein
VEEMMKKPGDQHMRLYMDVCCLGRPFDDLAQGRVYLEAEAVLIIISRCEKGDWTLLSSGTIDFEISQIHDSEVQEKINSLYSTASEHHYITQESIDRAKEFQFHNIGYFDSLHMAIAEIACVNVMLTTDDRLIKRSQNTDVSIRVTNPVTWLMEVTKNE